MSQNQGRLDYGLNNSYMKSGGSHITQSLKNQVKDLRTEMKKRDEEMNKLKRSLKATNIQELEVEMKLYVDECTRLRHMLEESYKNSMDPMELQKLQEQFQIQDNYLVNLQNENQELAETCAKMQQIMQSQQEENAQDNKLRTKLNRISANKKKLSKNLKLKDRELKQLKTDLAAARQSSKGGSTAIKSLNDRLTKYQKDVEDKSRLASKYKKESEDKNKTIQELKDQIAVLQMNPGIAAVPQQQHTSSQPTNAAPVHQKEKSEDYEDQYEDQYDEKYEEEYDEEYKDDEQQESNIIDEEPQVEEVNKDDEIKGEQKAIISEIDVDPLFEKLKLLLQRNKIKYNNMGHLFPSDITIMSLEHKLKSLGLRDAEERLTLSRYIIEPRSNKTIEFNENRSISKENAENVLKSKIETYKTFENEEDEMKERVIQQVGRYISTLKDALECEDLDGIGYIPANTLKSCFHAMDINLDDELIEYLIFTSGTLDKIGSSNYLMLEYSKIVDIVETEGQASENPYAKQADDLLNDENDDDNDENDYSDDYGNDFEEPKDEKEEESQDNQFQDNQPDDTEPQQPTGDDELDEEIDDEQMISIAEN